MKIFKALAVKMLELYSIVKFKKSSPCKKTLPIEYKWAKLKGVNPFSHKTLYEFNALLPD